MSGETPRSSFRLKSQTIAQMDELARWHGLHSRTRVIEVAVAAMHKEVPQWFKDSEAKRRRQNLKGSTP
jgi:hypothetical protein